MILPRYEWSYIEDAVDEDVRLAAKKEGLDDLAAEILASRHLVTPEQLSDFLHPDLMQLTDPYAMHDMQKAVDRIRQAIENGERLLVYGDYDADGMTAASILKEILEEMGAECLVYLPNRFTDGYGPNRSVYEYFINKQGVSLIITVDNGVAGHDAISYAQGIGVDVIVTDHHSIPDTLPEAFAILHPDHPDMPYPFPHLAGCGVAYTLSRALLETTPVELLDLVAIGTIADMVPLTEDNRIMTQIGLSVLSEGMRAGLTSLLEKVGVSWHDITEEMIGFQIAPRLNALGRLDDPNPAVTLLTSFDEEEVEAIAGLIDSTNEERKALVESIYQEAIAMVDSHKKAHVLAKEGWHPGVLGIVAGRIMEEVHCPVVILNVEDGIAKGSARSPECVNIFQALDSHRSLFMAFGGHAGAAGLTLEVDKLPELSRLLEGYIDDNQIDVHQKLPLRLDRKLDLADISLTTVESITHLAPYGMANQKPVFWVKDLTVSQVTVMGQANNHLKIRLAQDGHQIDLLAFGRGKDAVEFEQANNLEVAATLATNEWNGVVTVQLILVDARVTGRQMIDLRKKASTLPEGVPVWHPDLPQSDYFESLAIDELPDDLRLLKDWCEGTMIDHLYIKSRMTKAYYLEGYGTREQYARLYQTIVAYPEIPIRQKITSLARYLKIAPILLIKMIQIFEELGFISIENGLLSVVKDASKKELDGSTIYKDLKETVKAQEIMALGTMADIADFLGIRNR